MRISLFDSGGFALISSKYAVPYFGSIPTRCPAGMSLGSAKFFGLIWRKRPTNSTCSVVTGESCGLSWALAPAAVQPRTTVILVPSVSTKGVTTQRPASESKLFFRTKYCSFGRKVPTALTFRQTSVSVSNSPLGASWTKGTTGDFSELITAAL